MITTTTTPSLSSLIIAAAAALAVAVVAAVATTAAAMAAMPSTSSEDIDNFQITSVQAWLSELPTNVSDYDAVDTDSTTVGPTYLSPSLTTLFNDSCDLAVRGRSNRYLAEEPSESLLQYMSVRAPSPEQSHSSELVTEAFTQQITATGEARARTTKVQIEPIPFPSLVDNGKSDKGTPSVKSDKSGEDGDGRSDYHIRHSPLFKQYPREVQEALLQCLVYGKEEFDRITGRPLEQVAAPSQLQRPAVCQDIAPTVTSCPATTTGSPVRGMTVSAAPSTKSCPPFATGSQAHRSTDAIAQTLHQQCAARTRGLSDPFTEAGMAAIRAQQKLAREARDIAERALGRGVFTEPPEKAVRQAEADERQAGSRGGSIPGDVFVLDEDEQDDFADGLAGLKLN